MADGHIGVHAAQDGRHRIDRSQPHLQALEIRRRDQICLVQQQPVRKSHLRLGLVDDATSLLLVEMLLYVLGIDECYDPVDACEGSDGLIDEEGLRHWSWVGHACQITRQAMGEYCLVAEDRPQSDAVATKSRGGRYLSSR